MLDAKALGALASKAGIIYESLSDNCMYLFSNVVLSVSRAEQRSICITYMLGIFACISFLLSTPCLSRNGVACVGCTENNSR